MVIAKSARAQDIRVADAKAFPLAFGRDHVVNGGAATAVAVDHLDLFLAEHAAQHDSRPLPEGGLVHVELVRIDSALDDVLTEAIAPVMNTTSRKAGLGIQGKDHAARGAIGTTIFMIPMDKYTLK